MLNIVVVGGGLGGLSAAIALALSGHHITVLEAHTQFSELGAGIQMHPNSTRIMRQWSLLDKLATKAVRPKSLIFRSYKDGCILNAFPIDTCVEKEFGSPFFMVHRKDLLRVFVDKAQALGVNLQTDSRVIHLDTTGPTVTTSNGTTYRADLIIGADGERSYTRSVITGRTELPQATGRLVYRLTMDLATVKADPELHQIINTPAVSCWMGPQRHIIAYELPATGLLNIALTCPDPVEGRELVGPQKADMDELQQSFNGWDPQVRKLLEKNHEASFWTMLQLPSENRQWIDDASGCVLLIGDAAHSMTPYLAQGASQAIEDGAFLGHLFKHCISCEQVPALLRVFCESRQARTFTVRARAQKAGEIYEMPDGHSQESRDHELREGKFHEGFPNAFADPIFRSWLFGYDVEADAARHG